MAGLSPMWYHATNVALHAAACILVTRVSLVVAALRPGFAALTGLLFAAHPVHTEAVSDKFRDIPRKMKLHFAKYKSFKRNRLLSINALIDALIICCLVILFVYR